MELLVIILQIIKDLLGNLNPFRLISQPYRRQFLNLWRKERWVFRIGYIIGSILLIVILLSLLLLFIQ